MGVLVELDRLYGRICQHPRSVEGHGTFLLAAMGLAEVWEPCLRLSWLVFCATAVVEEEHPDGCPSYCPYSEG